MHLFLIVIHIFVAFALVIVILLQSGARGGGLAGTFGGAGGTGAIFGGRGAAPFLTKLTAILASVLIVTCISLFFKAPKVTVKVESKTYKEMQKQAEESSQARALSPSSLFEEQIESDSLEK
ncbi:MAG: preprotein translocase subunit SecG [Candidatus Latescibacteria bacterium]|nr:preprotein translocase subunit SecG [Candidatus Latescibacterota bacterium]